MSTLTESTVEEAALAWLASSGYSVACGPDIAVSQTGAERSDPTYRDVVLEWRLREALVRLNPDLPQEALDDAFRKVVRADGSIAGAQARVIDFDDPHNNDWLALNQFTVVGPQGHNRRADIVIFVNGLPLGVIELKNPADEKATIGSAFRQLETCEAQVGRREEPKTDRRRSLGHAIRTPHSSSRCYADPSNRCYADFAHHAGRRPAGRAATLQTLVS
jgi:type I restriction enzyme R subunit